MYRTVACAVVAAVALGAAGCGGSDSLTEAQLVKRADAVCVRLNERNGALFGTVTGLQRKGVSEAEAQAAILPVVTAQRRHALARLEGLTPPDGLQARYDALVDSMRATLRLLPTQAQARAGEDPHLKERQTQIARSSQLARALGLKDCR